MWVELKSYQFQCMQGYFPKDISSGKKRNGEAALFISVVLEFRGVDMGWMSVDGWMLCEFTTSSPSHCAHAQLFVGLSGDSAGISWCQYLFMAVSYSYLMNVSLDAQQSLCVTLYCK